MMTNTTLCVCARTNENKLQKEGTDDNDCDKVQSRPLCVVLLVRETNTDIVDESIHCRHPIIFGSELKSRQHGWKNGIETASPRMIYPGVRRQTIDLIDILEELASDGKTLLVGAHEILHTDDGKHKIDKKYQECDVG